MRQFDNVVNAAKRAAATAGRKIYKGKRKADRAGGGSGSGSGSGAGGMDV